jgi:hypothetical protein
MEQMARVYGRHANILHKRSRTTDSRWSFSYSVGQGTANFSPRKLTWYEILNGTSYLDRFFGTDGRAELDSSGSGEGQVAGCCEHGNGPSGSINSAGICY